MTCNDAGLSIIKKLNRLDYDGASSEFPRWCRAGGRTLPGLLRRRKVEQELFNA
jgi:lysozyme